MKFDDIFNRIMEADENVTPKVLAPDPNILAKTTPAPEETEEVEAEEPDNAQKNQDIYDQLKEFLSKGAKFATFIYKTQGTTKKGEVPNGPTKIYKVNFGINYGNIKSHNKPVIEAYTPEDEYEEQAKAEMLASLSKPYNPEEEKTSVYQTIEKGIRYNTEKDCLNILAQITGKPEIVAAGEELKKPGVYDLTLNKDGTPRKGAHVARAKRIINFKLQDQLRSGLTSFDLDEKKIAGVKMNGDIIEFHAEDKTQPISK